MPSLLEETITNLGLGGNSVDPKSFEYEESKESINTIDVDRSTVIELKESIGNLIQIINLILDGKECVSKGRVQVRQVMWGSGRGGWRAGKERQERVG